jgi:hypothetical protein
MSLVQDQLDSVQMLPLPSHLAKLELRECEVEISYKEICLLSKPSLFSHQVKVEILLTGTSVENVNSYFCSTQTCLSAEGQVQVGQQWYQEA